MLPMAAATPTSPSTAHIVVSSSNPSANSRAGRLRFSFRQYTHHHHNHHQHHQHHPSSSPAAPAVVTTTATSNSSNSTVSHFNNNNNACEQRPTPASTRSRLTSPWVSLSPSPPLLSRQTGTPSPPPPPSAAPPRLAPPLELAPAAPTTTTTPQTDTPTVAATLSSRTQRRATAPLNNTESNSWIPTVSGVSGLSRVASLPSAELSTSSVHATNVTTGQPPVRSIDEALLLAAQPSDYPAEANPSTSPMVRSPATTHPGLSPTTSTDQPAPSIRFTPHVDSRSTREALQFPPVERALRTKDERIRVGRYSDRDEKSPTAPVGFKSKVVSRRHCEFWCENGQWYVRDIKSSSGTFLNHIRLSAPGMESKPYPINDGDVLQLGIDFKGGEEQIFRCVKIRVELNRAWQKALNNFNIGAHRRLKNLALPGKDPDAGSINTSECTICLLSVAPCQPLFVAPCSHTWHYRCIRPVIEKEYPTFLCPNCRAVADLDQEIEEEDITPDLWETVDHLLISNTNPETMSQETAKAATSGTVGVGEATTATTVVTAMAGPSNHTTPTPLIHRPHTTPAVTISALSTAGQLTDDSPQTPPNQIASPRSNPWTMIHAARDDGEEGSSSGGENIVGEGPMTPMNNAGPFIMDGGDGHRLPPAF